MQHREGNLVQVLSRCVGYVPGNGQSNGKFFSSVSISFFTRGGIFLKA